MTAKRKLEQEEDEYIEFDLNSNGPIIEEEDDKDEEIENQDKDMHKKDESQVRFIDLKLQRSLLKQLHWFGFDQATPIQQEAIPLIMSDKDVWAVSATGTGKTAAFLLPILQKFLSSSPAPSNSGVPKKIHPALILLPTRELAVQCYDAAMKYLDSSTSLNASSKSEKHHLNVILLAGGMPKGNQTATLKKCRHQIHLIIGTPGRILDHCKDKILSLKRCSTLVLDEADRLLAEGFTDQLELLKTHLDLSSSSYERKLQVLLFSATLSDEVNELARQLQTSGNQFTQLIMDSSQGLAKGLRQQFYRLRQMDENTRLATLLIVLQGLLSSSSSSSSPSNSSKVIIFVSKKQDAIQLAQFLKSHFSTISSTSCNLYALHGDMNQQERLESLRSFASISQSSTSSILVATDVASRGLDLATLNLHNQKSTMSKKNVINVVVNYHMPSTYQIYQHRVGRTARAGLSGLAISLIGPKEWKLLKEAQKHAPFEHAHAEPRELDRMRRFLETLTSKDNTKDEETTDDKCEIGSADETENLHNSSSLSNEEDLEVTNSTTISSSSGELDEEVGSEFEFSDED